MTNFATLALSARLALPGLLVVGMLSTATEARATVVVLHSLEEMSRRADVVVHARVGDVRVVEREGHIATVVDIEVIDGWKGAKAGDLTRVYQLGGVLGARRELVVGVHTWQVGEEIVLFAMRYQDGLISYGIGVGKRVIDRSSGEPMVVEVFGDVSAMERAPEGGTRIVTPRAGQTVSLAALKTDVQLLAAKGQLGVGEPFVPDVKPGLLKPSFEPRGKKPTGGL
jgi:hypothetical protein